MSPELDETTTEEPVEPVGHVRVVYLGPVAPHWDVQSDFGPADVIDAFRDRVRPGWSCSRRTTRSSAATASASCATPSGRT